MFSSPRFRNRIIGNFGEKYAINFLKKCGYRIVTTNFTSKFGEVDIIATKDKILFFIEVKCRRGSRFGKPEEAVTAEKIRKLEKTAQYYSLFHQNFPRKLRIQVVALEATRNEITSAKIIDVF